MEKGDTVTATDQKPEDIEHLSEKAEALMTLVHEVAKALPPERQEAFRNYAKFRDLLGRESDRGCALVGAAYLDEEITRLLRVRMVAHNGNIAALLDQGRPLSAFSAKIRTAYAMGLIPDDVFHDINIIRAIRNKFAHLHGPLSFNDASISDQCKALRLAFASKKESTPRSRFIHVVTTVYSAMSIESRKERIQAPSADAIYELLKESEEATLVLKKMFTLDSAPR